MADGRKLAAALGLLVAAVGIGVALWPTDLLGECPVLEGRDDAVARAPPAAVAAASGGGDVARKWALPPWVRYVWPYVVARRAWDVWGARYDGDGVRLFKASDLAAYDGTDPGLPVLLGVDGEVFDVTDKGYHFYGPGAGYHIFAGRDSTRALALGSLRKYDLELGGDVSDLTPSQLRAVADQHKFYREKYVLYGRLEDTRPSPGAQCAVEDAAGSASGAASDAAADRADGTAPASAAGAANQLGYDPADVY